MQFRKTTGINNVARNIIDMRWRTNTQFTLSKSKSIVAHYAGNKITTFDCKSLIIITKHWATVTLLLYFLSTKVLRNWLLMTQSSLWSNLIVFKGVIRSQSLLSWSNPNHTVHPSFAATFGRHGERQALGANWNLWTVGVIMIGGGCLSLGELAACVGSCDSPGQAPAAPWPMSAS